MSSSGTRPKRSSAALFEIAPPLGQLRLGLGRLGLFLQLAHGADQALLVLPDALHLVGALAQLGDLGGHRRQPLGRGLVLLLAERLLLDRQRRQPPLDLIDGVGARIDLHLEPAGRLVDEIDRLVGELPPLDVAVRQAGRGDQRRVADADPVVDLVALLETAQDRDRVLERRLADVDRLEAALERLVLLDVLPVLVERGGADAAQIAARQRRLEHVGGVDRALGAARADQRVQLVDEQDDAAGGRLDLLEDGLEAVLELAAELGAGDERAEIERQDLLVLERLGDVAGGDALRDPLDDGGLADARIADQHRVVLGAAREDLHRAADLLVAADDRVELAVAGQLGQVARVLGQRLVLPLGLGSVTRCVPRTSASALRSASLRTPASLSARLAAPKSLATSASRRCSLETYSSLNSLDCLPASSNRSVSRRPT